MSHKHHRNVRWTTRTVYFYSAQKQLRFAALWSSFAPPFSYSVIERVKRYESALKKKEAGIDPGELVQRLRRQFAEKWIPMYKVRIVDGSEQELDRHG